MTISEGIHIKKLLYGGYGLANWKGKNLMVEYALPGEMVEAEVFKEKKDLAFGRVRRVIMPSSTRREPPCPHFGVCGGCQLQHMDYSDQLRAKEDMLVETFRRLGKLEVHDLEPSIYSSEFGYRVKMQFKVVDGELGLFERRSHNLVRIDRCLLAHPSINSLIPSLKEFARKLRGLREIQVLFSPHEGEFLLKLLSENIPHRAKVKKLFRSLLPKEVVGLGLYRNGRVYSLGRDFTFIQVGPFRYRVSMDSFVQVNYLLWESFVQSALPEGPLGRVLELHCGIGFFSLYLARKADFLLAYDSNRSAVRDAEYNAKVNSIDRVTFELQSSSEAIKKHAGEVIDLLFLDPPRSGLSEGEAKLIIKNRPRNIVYVSCEPTTLARDLKVLVGGGYSLKKVRMVDNFPNTYHIEVVTHLSLD